MGDRLDHYNEQLRESALREENKRKEIELAEMEAIKEQRAYWEKRESREELAKQFINFKNNARSLLLSEAIFNMFSDNLCTEAEKTNGRNLVSNYVKGLGVDDIFYRMPRTYACELIQHYVNECYNMVMEKVDKDEPSTFTMSIDDKIAMLDKLNDENDIEEVKQAIAMRVSTAEEEFVNNNIEDKYELDGIMNDTKDRIESVKKDNSLTNAEEIEQEMVNLSKQAMNKVREERPRNIFESMVRIISNSAMRSDSLTLRENFFTEGNFDMSKVVSKTRVLYNFLETVNTLRLENIDENYLKQALDELK